MLDGLSTLCASVGHGGCTGLCLDGGCVITLGPDATVVACGMHTRRVDPAHSYGDLVKGGHTCS